MILMELKVIKTVLSQYPVCKMCYDDDYVCSGGGGGPLVWHELVGFHVGYEKYSGKLLGKKYARIFLFIYIKLCCALYCVCDRGKRGAIDSTFFFFLFSLLFLICIPSLCMHDIFMNFLCFFHTYVCTYIIFLYFSFFLYK